MDKSNRMNQINVSSGFENVRLIHSLSEFCAATGAILELVAITPILNSYRIASFLWTNNFNLYLYSKRISLNIFKFEIATLIGLYAHLIVLKLDIPNVLPKKERVSHSQHYTVNSSSKWPLDCAHNLGQRYNRQRRPSV